MSPSRFLLHIADKCKHFLVLPPLDTCVRHGQDTRARQGRGAITPGTRFWAHWDYAEDGSQFTLTPWLHPQRCDFQHCSISDKDAILPCLTSSVAESANSVQSTTQSAGAQREVNKKRLLSLLAPDLITSWPTPDYQDFITSKVCWLGCLQCRAVRLTIDHYRAHITSQLDTMLSTTRVSSHYNMLGNSSALSVSLFTWSHCLLRGSVTALQLWLHSASLTAESSAATAASPGSERPLWHSHLPWTVIRGNKLHSKPTMTRHLLWHSLTERGRPKLQDKIADIYFCLLSPVQARCGPCLTERTRLISRSTGPAAAGGERPWTKFGAWAL